MAELPVVAACVKQLRAQRLSAALAGTVTLRFYESFAAVRSAAAKEGASLVILDARDGQAEPASATVEYFARGSSSHPVVLYVTSEDIRAGVITPTVADILVPDETDAPAMLRAMVLRVSTRKAVERVVAALRARLSGPLATVAETAVRHPACSSVDALSDRVGVQRQTLSFWCRRDRHLRPEELLVWCRLLLVSALLDDTGYSVTTLATALDFPSVIALRNQLKRYTGLTGLEIREAGFERILERFDDQVARSRNSPAAPLEAVLAAH